MADRTTEDVLRDLVGQALALIHEYAPGHSWLAHARAALALPSDTTTLRVEVERLTRETGCLIGDADKWRKAAEMYQHNNESMREVQRKRIDELLATVAERDREIGRLRFALTRMRDGHTDRDRHCDVCADLLADALAPPAVPQTGDKT